MMRKTGNDVKNGYLIFNPYDEWIFHSIRPCSFDRFWSRVTEIDWENTGRKELGR